MKQLVLIRHAKSSWKHPQLSDHDRPLNKRGNRNLPLMAEHIRQQGFSVERLVSSSAVRAATTAKALAAPLLQLPEQAAEHALEMEAGLYQFDWRPLWHYLKQQPDSLQRLALVGHNPALEELQQQLSGEWLSLPTCALVVLRLPIDHWHDLQFGCASLVYQARPKELSLE
ncbi:SixA phosphatase family protein [Motiliproteus sp.]|uniref:SixA phosphatase family protein n=1 Tax=Motiliproteus sp. TaxID=1898955 RepID=UPI003BA97DAA